jgi:cell fate regulator YaaT (PSP1 superfamily)
MCNLHLEWSQYESINIRVSDDDFVFSILMCNLHLEWSQYESINIRVSESRSRIITLTWIRPTKFINDVT